MMVFMARIHWEGRKRTIFIYKCSPYTCRYIVIMRKLRSNVQRMYLKTNIDHGFYSVTGEGDDGLHGTNSLGRYIGKGRYIY